MENNTQNTQKPYSYGKRPLWQWIVLYVVIALVAYGAVYYFFLAKKGGYTPTSESQMYPMVTATPSVQQTAGNAITIKNFAFNPGTLTVKAGTTVVWTNQDSVQHQIKADTFNSQRLNQGDSYQFTFSQKGTYSYSCAIHPSMTGTVIVE